jgi:hypothetical protein
MIHTNHHTSAVSSFLVRQDLYQNGIDKLAIPTLNFDTGTTTNLDWWWNEKVK